LTARHASTYLLTHYSHHHSRRHLRRWLLLVEENRKQKEKKKEREKPPVMGIQGLLGWCRKRGLLDQEPLTSVFAGDAWDDGGDKCVVLDVSGLMFHVFDLVNDEEHYDCVHNVFRP
jgi:hypothetical protein